MTNTIRHGAQTLAALGLLLLALGARAVDTEVAFSDPQLQARYEFWTHELRCLVCQNETIADSNATLAGDLRRELRGLVAAGRSDADIRAFMTSRYGDFVLYRPPVTGRTYLLWAAPVLLLLAGLVVVVLVILRRARRPLDADDEAAPGSEPPSAKTPGTTA